MAIIKAPNKDYTGLSAGVSFVKGKGETEDKWTIGWFKNKGYEVEEKEETEEPIENKPIDKLTKDEIKAKLDELEVEYDTGANKDALVEKLEEALSK